MLLMQQNGIPVPTLAAAVAYYDSYRAAVLPANLIQHSDYLRMILMLRIDKEGVPYRMAGLI